MSSYKLFPLFAALPLILSVATFERSSVWIDELSCWLDVAAKSPFKARARNNLGWEYMQMGEMDRAVDEFLSALNMAPQYLHPMAGLGVVYGKLGRLDDAISAFDTLARLRPDDFKAYIGLGEAYRKKGLFDRAKKAFGRAVEINPNNPNAHYGLAMIYEDEGRIDKAVSHWLETIRLSPEGSVFFNDASAHLHALEAEQGSIMQQRRF